MTAGISQSQSIDACRPQTTRAASGPAASAGSAPWARRDADDRRGDQCGEDHRADQPELGQRLDLERVRVAHEADDVALLEPLDAEAAGPDPPDRLGAERLERDAPVRGPRGAELGQPLVGGAERCGPLGTGAFPPPTAIGTATSAMTSTVAAAALHRGRPIARSGTASRRSRRTARAASAPATTVHSTTTTRTFRPCVSRSEVPFARRARTPARQPGGHGGDHARDDAERQRPDLSPRRRHDDEDDQARGQRGQSAARERQVQGHGERHGGGRGAGAERRGAGAVAGDADAEHDAHRGERALGVQ